MTRREKARIVATRVADRIREVAPTGLGQFDLAWELVAAPSDVFLDALAEWETEDSPTTRSKLEAASTALISAWAEAARHPGRGSCVVNADTAWAAIWGWKVHAPPLVGLKF